MQVEAASSIDRIALRLCVAAERGVAEGRLAQRPTGPAALAVVAAVAISAAGAWLPGAAPAAERIGETLATRSAELRSLAARMLGVRGC